jgi:hypothetical protein
MVTTTTKAVAKYAQKMQLLHGKATALHGASWARLERQEVLPWHWLLPRAG